MIGWEKHRLGELVEILSGFAFESEKFSDSGDMPIVRIRDVIPGRSSTYYNGAYDRRYVLANGEMLIGMDGEFNLARWQGGPALLNQRVCRIAASNSVLDDGYLFRFLPAALKAIEDVTPFVTVKHLSVKTIRDIQIPLPPLPEQRRIAEVLDRAETLRAKRRAALAQLDSLTQSLFLDLSADPNGHPKNWPKEPLKEVCAEINDCPHSTPSWTDEGIVCLRTSNLTEGGWKWDDTRYVSEEAYHQRSSRGYLATGDIVLSREGTVGIAAIVQEGMKFCMGQRLVQVRPAAAKVASDYLLRHLLYVLAPSRIGQFMVGSTSQHLNVKDLRALKIPLPPLHLQREFAQRVAAVEKLKASQRAALAELEALFSALEHRAFRGTL